MALEEARGRSKRFVGIFVPRRTNCGADRVVQPNHQANLEETAMSQQGVMTGKALIESDRVEGTTVYDPQGNDIGSIKRLMIEKISGRVTYAVMSFGGFLGMGEEEHAVPWGKLTYDTNLGGYRTDITEQQLRGAPTFTRDRGWDWSDRARERELHDYYRAPYYWGI
jgi:PRC-barrel domain